MGKRIIVKIGSQVLCDPNGDLNHDVLSNLVSQLGRLQADGWQVLVVSSGAVAAGSGLTNTNGVPHRSLNDKLPITPTRTANEIFARPVHFLSGKSSDF